VPSLVPIGLSTDRHEPLPLISIGTGIFGVFYVVNSWLDLQIRRCRRRDSNLVLAGANPFRGTGHTIQDWIIRQIRAHERSFPQINSNCDKLKIGMVNACTLDIRRKDI